MHSLATTLMLLGAACRGDGDPVCLLIGCDSGASFHLGAFPESDFARLTGATVEVCLNAVCRQQVIYELPPLNDVEDLDLGRPMDPRIVVSLWRTDPSGVIEILVDVGSDRHELFDDGDIYTVKLVSADARPLVNRAWSVRYRTWQPNGPDCEPTCRSATTTTEL